MRPFESPREKRLTFGLWAVAAALAVVVVLVLVTKDDSGKDEVAAGTTTPATTTTAAPATTTTTSTTAPATTTIAPTTTELATTTLAPTTTVAPTTIPETTVAPTTIAETTIPPTVPTTVPGPTNIVAQGTFDDVSSEHPSGQFPIGLAIDGDRTTSWMSAGDDDLACVGLQCGPLGHSGIAWRTPGNALLLITEVRILNNSQNTSGLATGNGFGSVAIGVFGEDPFTALFVQEVDLNGTGDDPDVVVLPNVVGRTVKVSFVGHDDPTSGGISELEIIAVPA